MCIRDSLHTACLLHLTLLGWRSSNSRNRRFGKLIIADDKLLASHHLALVYQLSLIHIFLNLSLLYEVVEDGVCQIWTEG